jgi:hypothetical protein
MSIKLSYLNKMRLTGRNIWARNRLMIAKDGPYYYKLC